MFSIHQTKIENSLKISRSIDTGLNNFQDTMDKNPALFSDLLVHLSDIISRESLARMIIPSISRTSTSTPLPLCTLPLNSMDPLVAATVVLLVRLQLASTRLQGPLEGASGLHTQVAPPLVGLLATMVDRASALLLSFRLTLTSMSTTRMTIPSN